MDEQKNSPENGDTTKAVRTYSLASKIARSEYDLRLYADVITETVQNVIPNVKVTVNRDSYTVYGISRGEAITIGKQLSRYFSDAALIKAVIFVSPPGEMFQEENLYYPLQ